MKNLVLCLGLIGLGLNAVSIADTTHVHKLLNHLRAAGPVTQLHEAACNDDGTLAKAIMDQQGKEGKIDVRDGIGRTPLHYAAKCGYEKNVELLIKAGADINARDNNDQTPLDLLEYKLELFSDEYYDEDSSSQRYALLRTGQLIKCKDFMKSKGAVFGGYQRMD